ncbi:hypothetical protein [Colwellia sp. PAMC 21821]|uniref:hypothetical protein n=1 Tax=Colwellia sp. PAMC 21821 TaxID=1816219 RepID=UPI0009BD8921|nr:hypothetical protein [Colwellia sp. PAMC 21821]ARD43699.1 hypothetical protein A3Q33_04905 [Colwellia sp. PAMC 21821]
MTRQVKPHLLSSIIVIVGLYCSTIQAETDVKANVQLAFTKSNVIIKMKSPTIKVTNNYAYPSITSEVFNVYHQKASRSFPQESRQPLPGIKVAEFSNLVPRKFDSNNSIFVFAAKFNDKLQQILAYFDFSAASTKSKDENISETDKKSKASLIVNNNKKTSKPNCSHIKS